jgi:hypothetical protein
MNPKQMARAGALGSSVFLAALLNVLILAQVTIAGPTVTVYKSPT